MKSCWVGIGSLFFVTLAITDEQKSKTPMVAYNVCTSMRTNTVLDLFMAYLLSIVTTLMLDLCRSVSQRRFAGGSPPHEAKPYRPA
jgi:hypothetical protein